jgi:succinate dehydrogenase/fumarate reductase flavoprotein subunit
MSVARQPGKIAFIFIDYILARIFSVPPNYISTAPGIAYAYFDDYRALRKDIMYTGHTVFQIAEKLSMDRVTLTETINRYNHFVASGKDDDFGRKEFGKGFHEGPFYVLGPLMGCFSTVEGGLSVDSECHVLTTEGKIIPRLYAAGSVGQGGLILPGHGLHIVWALVSGRIAGENAKKE